jgi:hypothetical protein
MSRLILLARFICTSLLKLILTSSKHGLLQREMKAESKQWIWNLRERRTHYSHRAEAFNIYSINEDGAGIENCYGLDDRGVGTQVPVGSRIFSSPHRPDQLWCPPNLLSPGVKRPGREADHSPPASAEVKKIWIYTSTPPYVFLA